MEFPLRALGSTGPRVTALCAGTAALGNNPNGVLVNAGARSNSIGVQGSGNVISGNVGAGIAVSDLPTENNVIAANFIGTNAAGNVAIANSDGILVVNSSAVIGGTNPVSRNVISGNTSTDMRILADGKDVTDLI